MRVNPKAIDLVKKIMQALFYIGTAHTVYEIFSIVQMGHGAHWYYGLVMPGLNYLLPLVMCCVFLMMFEKKK